jgi:hypothetical protein
MSTLDDLKKSWNETQSTASEKFYDDRSLKNIVKSRTRKHMKQSMHYFWASFFLQILVYALFSHVLIKYGGDIEVLLFCLAGIALFLPFTIVLIKKFKQMAIIKADDKNSGASLRNYVHQHYTLLKDFYSFKKKYELLLIPLSSAIGVFLIFKLFVPGSVEQNINGAITTFVITLASCFWSIRLENQNSFERPLHELEKLTEEFKRED